MLLLKKRKVKNLSKKRQTILEATAHKESAITKAQGDKEALILNAEAEKTATIARAKGEAEAIRMVYEAEATGMKLLKEAKLDESVITLKKLDAVKEISKGKANKIFLPTELASFSSTLGVVSEMLKDTENKE